MDFAKLQFQYNNFYAPAFAIEVDGTDLLKKTVEVFSMTVNNTLEGADDFSFTVNNLRDVDKNEFPYLQNGLFEVGKKVEVKVGYGDRKKLQTIFLGLITSVDVSFPANGISQLTVKGFDFSHKMMKGKQSFNWGAQKPIKYSDIVKKMAKEKYHLNTAEVFNTFGEHQQLKQDRESDYDFLKKKVAEKIGFELFVFKNDIYFRPPANDSPTVVTSLEWGKSLISFSPQINTAQQVSEVEVRGWDPDNQATFIGVGKRGQEHGRDGNRASGGQEVEDTQGKVVKHVWKPVKSKKQALDLAKSILDELAQEFVTGSGECIGIPDILPGKNIRLEGLGRKFSKVYYIEKTTHSVSSSGYKTTFSIKENTI